MTSGGVRPILWFSESRRKMHTERDLRENITLSMCANVCKEKK